MEEKQEYAAFISYRHKELDKEVAKKVHTLIERYTVPRELREKWGSDKLGKVFRDEEELPVSSNLTDNICSALDRSGFLIVICTSNTPESIWVEREIKYFLTHHDRSRVVAVLADGTPETSFPKPLTTVYDENGNETGVIEPLAANLTGVDNRYDRGRLKKEAVRLYAAILDCPFDSLWQREKRYRTFRMLALVSVLAAVALIYGISIYIKNQRIEEQNEEIKEQLSHISAQKETIESQLHEIEEKNQKIAEKNEELTKKNYELVEKNDKIEQQNEEMELSEALAYVKQGNLMLEKGDMNGAINSALHVLETSKAGTESYGDDLEYILSSAQGAEHYKNQMRTVSVLEQEEDISDAILSEDGSLVFTLDARGYIRCFDPEDGTLLWRNKTSSVFHRYVAYRTRLMELKEQGLLLYLGEDVVCAFSIDTGKEAWRVQCGVSFYPDFQVLSEDKTKLAFIESQSGSSIMVNEYNLLIINAATGEVEKRIPLSEVLGNRNIKAAGACSGVFSPKNRKLYGMVYYSDLMFNIEGYCVFSVDLKSGKVKIFEDGDYQNIQVTVTYSPFVIGIDYIEDKDSLLLVHYDSDTEQICTDEYSSDGSHTQGLKYYFSVPDREHAGEYRTAYTRCGDVAVFSCETIAFSYNIPEGRILRKDDNFASRIYSCLCLSGEENLYVYITEDGLQHLIWPGQGISSERFFDKTALTCLNISHDYLENDKGLFGFRVKDGASAVLISLTEMGKAYVLKTDKDTDFEAVSWYNASDPEHTGMNPYIRLDYIGNGKLALWEINDTERDKAYVSVINAETAELEKRYEIDTTDRDVLRADSMVYSSKIWQDARHFTYATNTDSMAIFDLETGEFEPVFAKIQPIGSALTELKDGGMLHAAINRTEASEGADPKYEISWRRDLGEIQSVTFDSLSIPVTGSEFRKKGIIQAGSNGLISVLLFSSEQKDLVDSFVIADSKTGETKVIKAEGTDHYYGISGADQNENLIICMAEEGKRFATYGKDRQMRLYDFETGAQKTSFEAVQDIRDVESLHFVQGDSKIALWTKGRALYIYDIDSGSLLALETINSENSSEATDVRLRTVEDLARNRVFFVTSRGASICFNTSTWKKQSDFFGFNAFCPETNELFRIKNSNVIFKEEEEGILKVNAYTLEDLYQKAKKNKKSN